MVSSNPGLRDSVGVNSPCVGICALNEQDICIGCFRSGGEISRWGEMSANERMDVLARVAHRESNSFLVQPVQERK